MKTRGSVTVEMCAASVFLLLPLLLGLGELVRLDLAARRLQFGAQRAVIAAAMSGNDDPDFRLIPVERRVSVSMRPEVRRLLGGAEPSATVTRRYWIATGSGHGAIGD